MSAAENINPQILVWARESAGLTIADAAAKIGLTATSQKTPESKLLELENGENGPTRHQLTKISSIYHRPLTVFYRNRIPTVEDRGEDFRTSAGEVTAIQCGLLDALLRDVRARQGMVRGIVESGEDYSKLAFVGSISVADRPDSVVNEVRRLLEIVTSAPPGHGKRDSKVLFDDLRTRVEKLGIFVVLMGNLGSHHSAIDSKVFRGFALADEIAPFIVINDRDAESSRPFTLIHEFVHVLLGSSGVSGSPSTRLAVTPIAKVERFCNDVAGGFLLPSAYLPQAGQVLSSDEAENRIASFARDYCLSEPMVAYRLFRTGAVSEEIYSELVRIYNSRWNSEKQRRKDQSSGDDSLGPNYYVVRRHRLGTALLDLVGETLRGGEITFTKAAKVLGVKPASVEPLIGKLSHSSGRNVQRQGG